MFTRKFCTERCLECTMFALFFSSSLMHSMMYLFLSMILSHMGMSLFFMFAFSPCTSCMPSSNRLSKSFLDIPSVCKDFSVQFAREHLPHPLVPVVLFSPCKTGCYNLPGVIAHEVKLEPVAPSHSPLPVGRDAVEDSVETPPHVAFCQDRNATFSPPPSVLGA